MRSLLPKDLMPLMSRLPHCFLSPYGTLPSCCWWSATLAPSKRTVNAILWMMELEQVAQFQKYHRVLNRAAWSAL